MTEQTYNTISDTVNRHQETARECRVTLELSVADAAAILEAHDVGISNLTSAEVHQIEVLLSKLRDGVLS